MKKHYEITQADAIDGEVTSFTVKELEYMNGLYEVNDELVYK